MGLREDCTDNGKHSPVGRWNKTLASDPAFWPPSMGAWDAPGFTLYTDHDPDGDGDESYISERTGDYADNPISQYSPADLNSSGK